MAERAGEIESSVRIPFAWKLDCLVGHARPSNREKRLRLNMENSEFCPLEDIVGQGRGLRRACWSILVQKAATYGPRSHRMYRPELRKKQLSNNWGGPNDRRADLRSKPLRPRERGVKGGRWRQEGVGEKSAGGDYGLNRELKLGGEQSGHRLTSDTRSTRPDIRVHQTWHQGPLSGLFMLSATFRIYNLVTTLDAERYSHYRVRRGQ